MNAVMGETSLSMKVAIIAPYSPSGESGGAERFYAGLKYGLAAAGADVEIVPVTHTEATYEDIIAGYDTCAALDLSAYDLVISTKAPTFNIRHPNHVVYLVHTVRVFYDMFDTNFHVPTQQVLNQQRAIHDLDTQAFRAARKVFTIGHEVSRRLTQWNGISSEVLHPPIDEDSFISGEMGDYFFLPGRLHPWKRVDLAINAVKSSGTNLKLVIAGTGSSEDELRALADSDPRITFRGRVSDAELKQLYANSRAVIFSPLREDYGYVTLEAFASGKPVITCSDSGEPLQFVRHGQTGLIAQPSAESIRQAMETLHVDPGFARELGGRALEVAGSLRWANVAERLLAAGGYDGTNSVRRRQVASGADALRVAVLDMQPISPAVGGGRQRLLGLYHALGPNITCRYVGSYDWEGEPFRQLELSPGLTEITVPLSREHHAADREISARAGMATTIDLTFPRFGRLSPAFIAEGRDAIDWADVVVFSHPWVYPLFADDIPACKTVIYDSHNVEAFLRAQILDLENQTAREILSDVIRTEDSLGQRADLVLACSHEDMSRFDRVFDWEPSKMEFAPNGVFTEGVVPRYGSDKLQAKHQLGLDPARLAGFFIGSDYGPNVEAAEAIIDHIAPRCPEVLFVIAGGVCQRLIGSLPGNVHLAGPVSDSERTNWLAAVDFAINPMLSGSGTNIKMFDFAGSGLPIITTVTGGRGIVDQSSFGITLCAVEDMPSAIYALVANPEERERAGQANRRLTETQFSWERISERLGNVLKVEFLKHRSPERPADLKGGQSRILHFSTVGQKCGIGEYTRHLMGALRREGAGSRLLASRSPRSEPQLTAEDGDAEIAWHYDNVTWSTTHLLPDIERRVAASGMTGAIIQHHPGFLPAADLIRLVEACQLSSVASLTILHAVHEAQIPLLAELVSRGVLLASHKASDVLLLQQSGVAAMHIPLAVADFQARLARKSPIDPQAPIIVSNGFLRAHKGFETLLEAFALLRHHLPHARLRLLTPEYPSQDSRETLSRLEVAIRRHGLTDRVDLDTRFREKHELIAEIAKCDLAVFPYGESAEGGSAAASDAIAGALPVIVSPSKIFDDLRHVAMTVPAEPLALHDAMMGVLNNPSYYSRSSYAAFAYAERHSWPNVAKTLLGALECAAGRHTRV